jgi:hypothetical protein
MRIFDASTAILSNSSNESHTSHTQSDPKWRQRWFLQVFEDAIQAVQTVSKTSSIFGDACYE